MKLTAAFLASLYVVLLGAAQANIAIPIVTVGNPGNPNDSGNGNLYGGVNYTYAIGKYEVTLTQYTEFLNAVAKTDTFSLYNSNMATNPNVAGISQSGVSGSFGYSVIGDGNRPITYVSWFDAARFTNWLHNGQPVGLQVAGTTEQGAYALNGATTGANFTKGSSAQWWIPTVSEWYKAAYYQPKASGGPTTGYWLYPMQSNSTPYSDEPPGATPDNTRVGNFCKDDGIANGYDDGYALSGSTSFPAGTALTAVGAYTSSDTYYGPFDHGGNVWEWNDAISGSSRGLRGGSWSNFADFQRSLLNGTSNPSGESETFGFRVATVPEPTVAVSLIFTGCVLLARRKRAHFSMLRK